MKKPSVLSLLITLLLVAAVCIQGEGSVVKDSAGNSLEPGKQYFIQQIKTKTNKGGGLVPAPLSLRHFCPLGIVTQTLFPYQPGLPITFSLPLGITDFIQTSQIVNIEFQSDHWTVCTEYSKFWKVDKFPSKEPYIVIGGSPHDEKSQFKIEDAGANTYKLTNITGTGIVGFTSWSLTGEPQLLLTEDTAKTIIVYFKRVDDTATTTTTSTSRVEKLGLRMFPFY